MTVRRLTSAEYAYAVRDLTGIDVKVGIDASSDSVGGEGFANFGDVQFVQDASVERYLEAAKLVADHAVVGAGPARVLRRHRQDRPRALGAEPHRRALREQGIPRRLRRRRASVRARALRQGVLRRVVLQAPRGARRSGGDDSRARGEGRHHRPVRRAHLGGREHSRTPATRPRTTVDALDRTCRRPPPTSRRRSRRRAPAATTSTRALTTWPSWFFARGDLAAGGAGDESPLVFDDTTLNAEPTHHYTYALGPRRRPRTRRAAPAPGPSKVHLTFTSLEPGSWRDARRDLAQPARRDARAPRRPRRAGPAPAAGAQAADGARPDRSSRRSRCARCCRPRPPRRSSSARARTARAIGPDDFATTGTVVVRD